MNDHSFQQEALLDQIEDSALVQILRAIHETQKEMANRIATVEKGFPGGDADGHRRAHEMMIEDLNERRKLRQSIQEKTIGGLVWAGVLALGSAVWAYIKDHVR